MRIINFKSAPVVRDLDQEDCGLPMSILAIIEAFTADYSLALPRSLTQEYMNCTGLGKKLLENEWFNYVVSFPWLVAILILTIALPLLCIVWCICQFRRKRRRHFEKAPVPMWRYILSTILFVLKIIYCFFLWFTYTSYQNNPTEHNPDPDYDLNELELFFDRTLNIINHVFTDNVDVMHEFIIELIDDIRTSINASTPDILKASNKSILEKMHSKGNWLQILLKKINEDMDNLLANTLQLLDITRLFHRNTTMFMSMGNISDPKYTNLISNEIESNYHKMLTFLHIEELFYSLNEIFIMSAEHMHLCETFDKSIEDLYNQYGFFLKNLWSERVNEMNENYVKMIENVKDLKANLRNDVTIRLPKDVYSYQLLFIIIVTMICLLCWLQLGYALYHTVYMKFRKKKYILVCIVVLICASSIILGLIASHSLFVGTSFYNFRQLTYNQDDPCERDAKPYCDIYNKLHVTNNLSIFAGDVKKLNTFMELQNQLTFETIHFALPSVASISNIIQLTKYANFMKSISNFGTIFNIMKEEFNMKNWYETYEQLNSHISIKDATTNYNNNETTFYETMLKCNLNMIKVNGFENLIGAKITNTINSLSKNTEIFSANLPIKDLTTLMRQCIEEIRIIHDFIEIDLKNLLYNKMADVIQNYEMELIIYNSHFHLMPSCKQFKLSGVGMPRHLYECIETCLHGFWIGAFALLVLLFPILIICIILTYLYDKYPYSTQALSNTGSSRQSGGSSRTSSTTATPTSSASSIDEETTSVDGDDDDNVKDKSDLRNKNAPRVKRLTRNVAFNADPKEIKTKRSFVQNFVNKQSLTISKIRDFMNSIISSPFNEQPDELSSLPKSSVNATSSNSGEVVSENEINE